MGKRKTPSCPRASTSRSKVTKKVVTTPTTPPLVCARLLLDVFRFLEMNEVERNQLVSKDWRDLVATSVGVELCQRRRFFELFITHQNNTSAFEPDEVCEL